MCGIVAVRGQPSPVTFGAIYKLLEESQIRGKHATGVSYLTSGKLKSITAPIPAKIFLEKYFAEIKADLFQEPEVVFIGHTRYSTSGLEFNQPIYDENLSIALNGVITQADPSHWPDLFGVECQTTNDAEILHKYLSRGKSPWSCFKTASMAVVGLTQRGELFAFRNTQRPAWAFKTEHLIAVASAREIIVRATQVENPGALNPGTTYQLSPDQSIFIETEVNLGVDLQTERF